MSTIYILLRPLYPIFGTLGKYLLTRKSYPVYFFLVLFFAFKNGVRGILPWADFSPIDNFPSPTKTLSSSSIGILAISKLFFIDDKLSFFILNLCLLFVFLNIFYFIVVKRFSRFLATLMFLLFLSSPIAVVLFGNVGRHDLLTIFGMLFFFLAKSNFYLICAILISNFGSPEHSIAAYLLLMIASLFNIVGFRREATLALLVSSVYFMGIQVWLNINQEDTSRFREILPMVDLAIRNSLNNGHLELFSYFGYFWFTIFFAVLLLKRHRTILITLILFPIFFNIIMVDKTRDFVIALIPLALALHIQFFGEVLRSLDYKKRETQEILIGCVLVISVILPSFEITFEGKVRSPYEWFWSKTL